MNKKFLNGGLKLLLHPKLKDSVIFTVPILQRDMGYRMINNFIMCVVHPGLAG